MTGHSPEPWREGEDAGFTFKQVLDANGTQVCIVEADERGPNDVRRILACINACRGIPTEDLEEIAPDDQGRLRLKHAIDDFLQA